VVLHFAHTTYNVMATLFRSPKCYCMKIWGRVSCDINLMQAHRCFWRSR